MKKIYLLYFLFLMLSFAATSCSDGDGDEQPEEIVPITVDPVMTCMGVFPTSRAILWRGLW